MILILEKIIIVNIDLLLKKYIKKMLYKHRVI